MDEDATDVTTLRTVADYQFGAGAGTALFPPGETPVIRRTASGRPRQVFPEGGDDGERLVTFATDGRFTLGFLGGRRLLAGLDAPTARVVVGDESVSFVRDGKNVFAKFVVAADPDLRAGDEAVVVHEDGTLLAVGRAELDAAAMADFQTGMAVKVRTGADEFAAFEGPTDRS
ncbi:MAG TPA: PUA domain-containing protein [Halobacteriales archaeon]|nr:PUA domain-containing protein [Halobacteriales archaeon]